MVTDQFEFEMEVEAAAEPEDGLNGAQQLALAMVTIVTQAPSGCPWYVHSYSVL